MLLLLPCFMSVRDVHSYITRQLDVSALHSLLPIILKVKHIYAEFAPLANKSCKMSESRTVSHIVQIYVYSSVSDSCGSATKKSTVIHTIYWQSGGAQIAIYFCSP